MRRGYTLVELAITLGIITILAAAGYGSIRGHLPRFRLVGVGKTLRGDLMTARNLALSTNRQVRVRLTGSGGDCSDFAVYGGSWQLEIGDKSLRSSKWDVLPSDLVETGADTDQSEGIRDIGPDGVKDAPHICLRTWDPLTGPGTGNDDAVVFSPRGWVENPADDFDSRGYIVLTFVNQEAALDGVTDEVTVTVSRAGVVHLTTDASALPEVGTARGSAGT